MGINCHVKVAEKKAWHLIPNPLVPFIKWWLLNWKEDQYQSSTTQEHVYYLGVVSLPFNCLDFLCWVFGKLLRSITFIQFQNMFTTEKSWKRWSKFTLLRNDRCIHQNYEVKRKMHIFLSLIPSILLLLEKEIYIFLSFVPPYLRSC